MEGDILGESHRQVLGLLGHNAAAGAVHGGDGRAPVALAAEAPVLKLVGGGLGGALAQLGHHGRDRVLALHAGKFAAVHQGAQVPFALGLDDLGDGQAVLGGELEVPLVVGGHAHDGAGAIVHEHVVGGKDGHLFAGEGVEHGQRRAVAQLHVIGEAVLAAYRSHGITEGLEGGVGLGGFLDDRVLCAEGHEGDAEEGVQARREHFDLATVLQIEGHAGPLGTANPVLLHGLHVLGPVQAVHAGQQFVRVLGGLEEVLLQRLLRDGVPRSLVLAVHHLFVGQHGAQSLTPIHGAHGAENITTLPHLEEEPLVPAVVVVLEAGDLALPVVADAHLLDLPLHLLDVGTGPDGGVDAVLDGGVLGGQAEAVPAQWVHDLVATHAAEARRDIAQGVVAHMPHVDAAAGIREHDQHVKGFGARQQLRRPLGAEGAGLEPAALDLGFLGQGLEGHGSTPLEPLILQGNAALSRGLQ